MYDDLTVKYFNITLSFPISTRPPLENVRSYHMTSLLTFVLDTKRRILRHATTKIEL